MEFNDRRPKLAVKNYTVITQHGAERKVRRTKYATFEEARMHTQTHTPDTDGGMVPNVDQKFVDHKNYEAGGFWPVPNGPNRHAAIHYTGLGRD